MLIFGGWTFGSWAGHEGGALMDRIKALYNRSQKMHCPPPPWEDTAAKKTVILEQGNRVLPRHWICSALIIGFSASKTVRNTFLLFKITSLRAAWRDQDIQPTPSSLNIGIFFVPALAILCPAPAVSLMYPKFCDLVGLGGRCWEKWKEEGKGRSV